MSFVLSNKNGIRARKPHRCCLCGERIYAGNSYDIRKGVSSGDFCTMHMHPECHRYEQQPGIVDQEWYEDVSFPAFERADALAFSLKNI